MCHFNKSKVALAVMAALALMGSKMPHIETRH